MPVGSGQHRPTGPPPEGLSGSRSLGSWCTTVRYHLSPWYNLGGRRKLTSADSELRSAAFSAGTVLALATFPPMTDRASGPPKRDSARRTQAKKDLYFLVSALKEIGPTWTTALTSAGVLEGEPRGCLLCPCGSKS